MSTVVKNANTTCLVSYYWNSNLIKLLKVQLPPMEGDLFNGISFELDRLFDLLEEEPHLVAQVADPDGNPIYRCTRGREDGILQVEDFATSALQHYSDFYIAYSEESYDFEIIHEILH